MGALQQSGVAPGWMMCLVGFGVACAVQISSPILALYVIDCLGGSIASVSLAVSAFGLASGVFKPAVNFLARGRHSVHVFAAGLLIMTFSLIGYTLAWDPYSLTFFRAMHGLGFAFFLTLAVSLITFMVPATQRNETLARFAATQALGLMAGPAIGTVSVVTLGVRHTFLLAATFAGLSAATGLVMSRMMLRATTELQKIRFTIQEVRSVLSNRMFKIASFALLSNFVVYSVLLAYAPIHAKRVFQFSEAGITLLFFGYFASTAGLRVLLGKLRHMRKERILVFGLVNSFLTALVIALSPSWQIFAVAFLLSGLTMGIIYPISAMMVSESTDPSHLVLANSVYLVCGDVGSTIGPLITASIAVHGTHYAIGLASIVPILVTVFVLHMSQGGWSK